jgi:uncharacterized protein YndB with AHSA1/START domain
MITSVATFDAAPQELFDVLADVAGHTRWQTGVTAVQVASGDGRTVGTRYSARFEQSGITLAFEGAVVEHTRPSTLRHRLDGDEATLEFELRLVPLGSGTRLEQSLTLRLKSFALKMLKGVIEQRLNEKLAADVRGLRALLEARD